MSISTDKLNDMIHYAYLVNHNKKKGLDVKNIISKTIHINDDGSGFQINVNKNGKFTKNEILPEVVRSIIKLSKN